MNRHYHMNPVGGTTKVTYTSNQKSPCVDCSRADKPKDVCLEHCKRLSAWRRGKDHRRVAIPKLITREDFWDKGTGICAQLWCSSPSKNRGLCVKHYNEWYSNKLIGFPKYFPYKSEALVKEE